MDLDLIAQRLVQAEMEAVTQERMANRALNLMDKVNSILEFWFTKRWNSLYPKNKIRMWDYDDGQIMLETQSRSGLVGLDDIEDPQALRLFQWIAHIEAVKEGQGDYLDETLQDPMEICTRIITEFKITEKQLLA